jgi:hypothetical protein
MSECKKEFATLIRATLQYLQDEWGEHIRLSLKEPPPKHSKKIEEEPRFETPAPLPVEKKKNEDPKPSSNWILNPLPLPAEFPTEFSSLFRPIPLSIPIRLVVAEQSQIFFLESVARALTKLIAPAMLYSGKIDPLLTNSSILLILAPLSLLKKRFPQVELHKLLKFDGPALLPLADHYDLELKRALWNILKSFQNMLPSSSM